MLRRLPPSMIGRCRHVMACRLQTQLQQRCFVSKPRTSAGGAASRGRKVLSRKEMRRFKQQEKKKERKQRKEAVLQAQRHQQHQQTSSVDQTTGMAPSTAPTQSNTTNSRLTNLWHTLQQRLNATFTTLPRIPATDVPVTTAHYQSLAYRLPLFLLIGGLLYTDSEDWTPMPYSLRCSIGPSMLPTIHFFGDVWLVQNWGRSHRGGEVVLWKDPRTQQMSCKRIVGVAGDRVRRYGQYAHLYQDRDDLGIVWPRDRAGNSDEQPRRILDSSWDDGADRSSAPSGYAGRDHKRTIEVPPGHVWVEGDCPLFSLDSRHYGPVPSEWVRGNLVLRLWPLKREHDETEVGMRPRWVKQERPVPFGSIEEYLGRKFSFYRVPKLQQREQQQQDIHPAET